MNLLQKIVLLCTIVCLSTQLFAQTELSDSLKTRPFQISFVYPLGTNGIEGYKYKNNVSINILAGLASGVDGTEVSCLMNINDGEVNGVQISGLINANNGNLTGAQVAGLVNAQNGKVDGIQGAGFANLAKGTVQGGQIAGFTNATLDSLAGIQYAGFYNHANKKMTGAQAAGFVNYAGDNVTGSQVAGFANIGLQSLTGIQASGFANFAKGKGKGVQIAGFTNIVTNEVSGFQAAGFANIATDTITGVQLSGFTNFGKYVNGYQIGVVNINDTIVNGIPIGFLSISRNGYYAFDIEANETMYANIAFKMGVERFYNIFSMHARVDDATTQWGFGYGFGTNMSLGKKLNLNVDLMSAHLNQDDEILERLNLLNSLKIQMSYPIIGNVQLFAGPNLNVLVRDNLVKSCLPYTVYNWNDSEYAVDINIGASIGVRF